MAGDLANLKKGAQTIVELNVQNQALTDTAAEILLSYYDIATDQQVEALSWLAKSLGHSTSGRYSDTLNEIKEKGSHGKLRRHAKKSLKRHGEAVGEQYQKGMLGKEVPDYYL